MNAIFVYVLKSEVTGQHYVGISKFGPKRIRQHNKGQSKGTRGKGPWELIYQEEHPGYSSARAREQFLKSGKGREWLRLAVGEQARLGE